MNINCLPPSSLLFNCC